MTNWVKVECPLCGEMAVAETHQNLKRTWVGLTDKDWKRNKHSADFQKGVDWAEEMLKGKNT
jgi:hypothetical protein